MTSRNNLDLLDRPALKEVREFVGPTSIEHMAVSKATPDRFCYPFDGQYRQPFGEDCKGYGRKEDGCCVVDQEFLANVFVVGNNMDQYDLEDIIPVYADVVKWCLSRESFMLELSDREEITLSFGEKYAFDLLKLIANTPTFVTVKEECYDEDEDVLYYITRYNQMTWYIDSRESEVFRSVLEASGTIHNVIEGTNTLLSPNPSNYPFSFQQYTIDHFDYTFFEKTNFSNRNFSPGAVCISDIPLVIKDDRFACRRITFHVRCYIRSNEKFDDVIKDILLAMMASKVRDIELNLTSNISQVGIPGYTQIPRVATHRETKAIFGTAFRLFMKVSGLRKVQGGYDDTIRKYHVERKTPRPGRPWYMCESYLIYEHPDSCIVVLKKDTQDCSS